MVRYDGSTRMDCDCRIGDLVPVYNRGKVAMILARLNVTSASVHTIYKATGDIYWSLIQLTYPPGKRYEMVSPKFDKFDDALKWQHFNLERIRMQRVKPDELKDVPLNRPDQSFGYWAQHDSEGTGHPGVKYVSSGPRVGTLNDIDTNGYSNRSVRAYTRRRIDGEWS